jgi:hypothetical protein
MRVCRAPSVAVSSPPGILPANQRQTRRAGDPSPFTEDVPAKVTVHLNLPSGVQMIDIIAWIDIALGLLIGVVNLIKLAAGQAGPEMAERRVRRNAWLNLLASLLIIGVGVTGFGFAAKSDATEWVLRLATFAVVSFMLILWLRPRVRGKPTGETTEAAKSPGSQPPPRF